MRMKIVLELEVGLRKNRMTTLLISIRIDVRQVGTEMLRMIFLEGEVEGLTNRMYLVKCVV